MSQSFRGTNMFGVNIKHVLAILVFLFMVIHTTIILFYLYKDKNIEGTATSKNIKSKEAIK